MSLLHKTAVLLSALFLFWISGNAQISFIPGQTYFGTNQYVEYIAGNLPIIISAPHGGYIEPDSIPDRTCNSPTLVRDSKTQELARKVDSSFFDVYGCHPHVIICRMARTKLDCNRNLADGACGNAEAELSWTEYQAFIDSAKQAVMNLYGKGFFIDLHGHGHTIQRLELGYLFNGAELQQSDSTLDSIQWVNQSSYKNLVNVNPLGLSHSELLRGPLSLGTMLRQHGFPSVPSDSIPFPQTGDPFFSGGYNTSTHSSRNGGTIDGLQIEINMDSVRDSDSHLNKFSDSLVASVREFIEMHIFTNQELVNCGVQTDRRENSLSSFAVFPNPFSDRIQIISAGAGNFRMLDIHGRNLFEKNVTQDGQNDFQTEGLSNGVYYWEWRTEKKAETGKLIKF